jgi:hypothetical protein
MHVAMNLRQNCNEWWLTSVWVRSCVVNQLIGSRKSRVLRASLILQFKCRRTWVGDEQDTVTSFADTVCMFMAGSCADGRQDGVHNKQSRVARVLLIAHVVGWRTCAATSITTRIRTILRRQVWRTSTALDVQLGYGCVYFTYYNQFRFSRSKNDTFG